MSLAFSALVLFLLLSPGIAFRLAFLKSDSLRSNISTSVVNELLFAVIPSIVIHVILVNFLWFRGMHIPMDQLYCVVVGAKNTEGLLLNQVAPFFNYFLLYLLGSNILGIIMGYGLQRIVLKTEWDNRFYFLKISNDWDRLFSGRELSREQRKKLEFVQIDAVVGSSEGDMLYSGMLQGYTLSASSGLDKIYLIMTYRRYLKEDKPIITQEEEGLSDKKDDYNFHAKNNDDRYYRMPGNYFVLSYQVVKSINVTYRFIEKIETTNKAQKSTEAVK